MKLKPSRYNVFIPYDTSYLVFNGISGALAQIEPEKYQQYQNFVNQGISVDEEFLQGLIYGGFLIDQELDERQLLKKRMLAQRYSSNALSLTIAPTLRCNFRCPYCYEEGAELAGMMDEHVQDLLVKFIEENYAGIRTLDVTWYGGEPLMGLDVISRLTARFREMSERLNFTYSAHMVTNGYLLTTDNVQKLKELGITTVQITLDGPPESHNQRRTTVDRKPTFAKILENIKAAADHLGISVRVNVDKQNINECEQIIDIMKNEGLQEKIYLYFASVDAHQRDELKDQCYSREMFSTHNMIFRRKLIEAGFKDYYLYPQRKGNYCGADSVNSFVIDPLGYCYKCWSDIGFHDKAVHKLGEDGGDYVQKFTFEKNVLKYLLFDPTEDANCSECKILPLCMGGCPYFRVNQDEFCDEVKYQLDQILRNVVEFKVYEQIGGGQ